MNYEKRYKEALENAKEFYDLCKKCEAGMTVDFLEATFPELLESNDERIRKELIAHFRNTRCVTEEGAEKIAQWVAWLEEQENTPDKEYVFRSVAGDTIEKAAERAVELGGKVVLAFNGAYIPVDNKTKDEIVAEYRNWLEKQDWLEKQEQGDSKKVSIWKHWKDGICGNGEGKQIYLIKMGNTYSLSSCLGFECDYIELSELDNLMFEKQGEQKPIDYNEELKKCRENPLYSFDKYVKLENKQPGWSKEDEQSKNWILEYLYDGLRRTDEQFKEEFKAAIAWLKKQSKKQSIWTDNDRTMAFTLMRDVGQMTYISNEGKNERLEWLNSLEDKFNNVK